ncbi:MAG TPA: hypothetical protein PL118_02635 [Rectinema sp.]|nr:hypothetical protein [Rectinema sp.]HOI98503.1 hypothetical protein [Rectinema sp.]HPV59749.1 hypothetical protein [Rectinema sp.]HQL85851.1 hypothetical protein [Rectinema sp.]
MGAASVESQNQQWRPLAKRYSHSASSAFFNQENAQCQEQAQYKRQAKLIISIIDLNDSESKVATHG